MASRAVMAGLRGMNEGVNRDKSILRRAPWVMFGGQNRWFGGGQMKSIGGCCPIPRKKNPSRLIGFCIFLWIRSGKGSGIGSRGWGMGMGACGCGLNLGPGPSFPRRRERDDDLCNCPDRHPGESRDPAVDVPCDRYSQVTRAVAISVDPSHWSEACLRAFAGMTSVGGAPPGPNKGAKHSFTLSRFRAFPLSPG